MASPNLTTECSATPQFSVIRTDKRDVHTHVLRGRTKITWKGPGVKARRWRFDYKNQSAAQRSSFETFYDARNGSENFFYFNDIGRSENDIKVYFATEPEVSFDSPATWSWSVELEEII